MSLSRVASNNRVITATMKTMFILSSKIIIGTHQERKTDANEI